MCCIVLLNDIVLCQQDEKRQHQPSAMKNKPFAPPAKV